MEILAEISPLDPATGNRVTLRVCSADDRRITATNGLRWWPAIMKKPSITHDLFDGNFTGTINTGTASLEIAMFGLKRASATVARYRWAAAPVNLYSVDPITGIVTEIFTGIVNKADNTAEKLKLDIKVNTAPLDGPALTLTYFGTGGIEGTVDLRNKVKPWCLGACSNVEAVLIDGLNSVYQVSAYGAIDAVVAVYEKAASFGAGIGDYASYLTLVAATVPPGRWATCLASGLFRLGAPAAGVITADVQGDAVNGFVRLTGAIITRIVQNANALPANIAASSITTLDTASLAALDTAVPRPINVYLTQQITLIQLVQELVRPCNAAAGVSWLGKLFVARFGAIGTSAITLDALGRRKPVVSLCDEQDVQPPYWRVEMQGHRSWRVHTATEIAFLAALIDLGDYLGTNGYREGNIVVDQGARWLYVNPTASVGNAPPALPSTINSYWQILSSPPDAGHLTGTIDFASQVAGAAKPEANATRNVSAGTYSSAATYYRGDFVRSTDGTSTYVAKSNPPVGTLLTNTAYFDLFITGGGGTPGQAAYSGYLTNAPIGIATAADGSGGSYSGASGIMRVFEGFTERTSVATFTLVDSVTWATIGSSGGAYSITDPGADQASVRFDASYSGVTVRLTLNVTKSKAGGAGPSGSNGSNGSNGNQQIFVFQAAPSLPSTPTGNGVPSGWTLAQPTPAGGQFLYMSQAQQTLTGVLTGSWSTPVVFQATTTTAATRHVTGFGQSDTSATLTILIAAGATLTPKCKIRVAGVAGAGDQTIVMQWRVSGGSFANLGTAATATAGSPGDTITALYASTLTNASGSDKIYELQAVTTVSGSATGTVDAAQTFLAA